MAYEHNGPLAYIGDGYEPTAMAPYQTYPIQLGQLAPVAPLPTTGFGLSRITIRQVLTAIVVVIIAALIMRQVMKLLKGSQKIERNAVVSRLSTKELATRLYERLDAKGRANPATLRSLERLGR